MTISTQNVTVRRGDTRRKTFLVRDKTSQAVVDLSGWSGFVLTITISGSPDDDTTEQAQLAGSLSTDGTDGRVFFVPDENLPAGVYYYDAQAIDDNGEKITFVEGTWTCAQDRTKI